MIRRDLAPPAIAVVWFDLRCATLVLPVATGRNVSSPPRSLPKQAFNATRQQTASTEIPIASDARSLHTSRGFLPWRFADAGPGERRATFMGPPSANLHTPDSCIAANRGTRVSQVEFMSGWRKIVGCSRPPRSAGSHLEECNFLVAVVTLTSDCCGGRHRGRELRHNSSSAADRRG